MTRSFLLCAILLGAYCSAHAASPLVQAGDYQFRHDIMLLRDAGLLSGPVTLWPVSLPQINADLRHSDVDDAELSHAVRDALGRVKHRLRRAHDDEATPSLRVRGGSTPKFLRSFADTPRGRVEAQAGLGWTADHFAGDIRISGVDDDPKDDKEFRLDGSWLGGVWGNWMLAGGLLDRHFGPGWQGSLIVSNNARPRPGITLRRIQSDPFETILLSWLGPWHFTLFVEQLESDRGVPNALFAGTRFAFSPFKSLELGISRSSQFGGEDNDVGFDTIVNVITGQTTDTNPAVGSAEGINQLGGFDGRWKLPYINVALYGELTAEDEQGIGPFKFLGQGGAEIWGGIGRNVSWRLILEQADTEADIVNDGVGLGVAYNNGDFPTGYRYRDRVLGHPAESDALLTSARLLLSLWDHTFINLAFLDGELNRTPGGRGLLNTVTIENENVQQVELAVDRQFPYLRFSFEIGHSIREPVNGGERITDTFGWVGLSKYFQ